MELTEISKKLEELRLSHKYGDSIGQFLARRFETAIGAIVGDDDPDRVYYNFDNFRVCDITNSTEVKEYEEHWGRGYCYSFDSEYTHHETGRKFKLGFNYDD